MSTPNPLVPPTSYEQIIQNEQQQEIQSSTYWQKVSEFYNNVYDGMDYSAYIASGHKPVIFMARIASFVNRHKIVFSILGSLSLIGYLFRMFSILVR